jgi:Flp pilus assembly protein TadG
MQIDWMMKLRLRLCHQGRRLSVDTRGMAAVEFAMVVPLMLMAIFGTIQFSTVIAVDRKVSQTARTLSDLISQASSVVDTDFSNAFGIVKAILSPYPNLPANTRTTISQIYIDPTTKIGKVVWSKASGTGATLYNYKDVVTVPSTLQIGGTYLILSEISYDYQPIVGYDIKLGFASSRFTLGDKMFTRPRQSACVTYSTWTSCPTTGSLP